MVELPESPKDHIVEAVEEVKSEPVEDVEPLMPKIKSLLDL